MSAEQQHDSKRSGGSKTDPQLDWLTLVRKHVESLKFGTLQITVHDGRVMELVRSEKVRLDRPK